MATFRSPQVVLLCRDVEGTAAFYEAVGFTEVFRTPQHGPPIHVDLELDGYRLGLAGEASVRSDHGLQVDDGHRAVVVLWTDDTPAAWERLQVLGATPVRAPDRWLDRLLVGWLEDPAGHLVQVVQQRD